jgi:hypothetical protein
MQRLALWSVLLAACSGPDSRPVDAAPPPALSLVAGPAAAGYPLTVTLAGADPSTRYQLFRSTTGAGPGPCLPAAPAVCLGLVGASIVGLGTTDNAGAATAQRVLGARASGRVWLQASARVNGVIVTSAVVRIDVASATADADADGLTDADEVGLWGTDPHDRDSDGDRARDGVEIDRGIDPLNPDTDGDGITDGVDVVPRQLGPFDPFVPVDDLISDPADSLPDPEFDNATNRIVWEHDDGSELWVADLNPNTGAITPIDGRGELIAVDVAPMGLAKNGPEWMVSSRGSEPLFSKRVGADWLVHRASRQVGGAWATTPVAGTEGGLGPIGSLDAGDPAPRVMYARTPPGGGPTDLFAREIDDPATEVVAPDPLDFPRWIPGQPSVTAVSDRGAADMVVQWDTDTQTFADLTADGVDHGSVFFFNAPELGGEQLFFTTNASVRDEPQELQVWRRVGGVWVANRRITMPPAYPYVVSPEPFEFSGRSYVSYIASTEPLNSGNGRAVVYVASLIPGNDVIRRVSDDGPMIRKDPESYTGGVRPWIYYSEITATGQRLIHRCETGL